MHETLLYQVGTTLDKRFTLNEILGQGAVGVVYRATDCSLGGEDVAVKVLYPHLVQKKDIVNRFRNEVRVARTLAHPNIARVFEWGSSGSDRYYFVMEHVCGASLRALLDAQPNGRFEVQEAVRILYEITDAVSHAHQKGIIHRDIKPDNIIVDTAGIVKVLDFGLARIVEDDSGMTRTGESLGTAYYMSPEQFRGVDVDFRSDIYAIGIIAFELVAGFRPYDKEVFFQLALQHLSDPLPALPAELQIPEWYVRMIEMATAKDQADRYSSVAELSAIFASNLDGKITSGRDEQVKRWRATEYRRLLRKRRQKAWVAGARGVAIASLLLFAYVLVCRFNVRQWRYFSSALLSAEKRVGSALTAPLRASIGLDVSILDPKVMVTAYQRYQEANDAGQQNKVVRAAALLSALIDAGADLHVRVPPENTLLFDEIMKYGPEEALSAMLDRGLDPNKKDASGTPLVFVAVHEQKARLLERVIGDRGFDPTITDAEGNTGLHLAISSQNISAIVQFANWQRVDSNARVYINVRNVQGLTPLHVALQATGGAQQIILRALLKVPTVDLNARFPDGTTPLQYAVSQSAPFAAAMLIASGADTTVLSAEGKTLMQLAQDRGDPQLIALLAPRNPPN